MCLTIKQNRKEKRKKKICWDIFQKQDLLHNLHKNEVPLIQMPLNFQDGNSSALIQAQLPGPWSQPWPEDSITLYIEAS